eukprot:COSAG02_NODE_90_length_37755_cov_29.833364_35_plen_82_part_00
MNFRVTLGPYYLKSGQDRVVPCGIRMHCVCTPTIMQYSVILPSAACSRTLCTVLKLALPVVHCGADAPLQKRLEQHRWHMS